MGETKKIRKKIEGHEQAVREHQEKIDRELQSPNPDRILIETWKKHLENARRQIEKLERRSNIRKRRG
jgi:hypothetical protein